MSAEETEPLDTIVIYLPQEVAMALLMHGCTIMRPPLAGYHHRCTVVFPAQTRILEEDPSWFPRRHARVQLPDGYAPWYVQLYEEGPGLFYRPERLLAQLAEGKTPPNEHEKSEAMLMSKQELKIVITMLCLSITWTDQPSSPEAELTLAALCTLQGELMGLYDQEHAQPDAIPVRLSLLHLILLEEHLHLHLAIPSCSPEEQPLVTGAFERLLAHLYAVVAQQGSAG